MTFCEYQSAYCKNCGQTCTPQKYERPREYYDSFNSPTWITDWRSPCCKDELSEDPVTDQCQGCGAIANLIDNENFQVVDGEMLCSSCCADYRDDHPSLEDLPEDNWREDR